jgi:hypothetical protein
MQRILSVQTADVFVLKSKPPLIGVTAAGQVPTTGWTEPQLTPWFYIAPPADGIQDFDFQAEPPSGLILPVTTPIAASTVLNRDPANYWGEGLPLRGVRIHGKLDLVIAQLVDGRDAVEVHNTAGDNPVVPWPWLTAHPALAGDEDPFPLSEKLDNDNLLGKTLRVYRTGDPLSDDFDPERANIELSPETEQIVSVWIG